MKLRTSISCIIYRNQGTFVTFFSYAYIINIHCWLYMCSKCLKCECFVDFCETM